MDELDITDVLQPAGHRLGAGLGRSPSIPVRSKRLELAVPAGRDILALGRLGGGADEQSNGKCRLMVTDEDLGMENPMSCILLISVVLGTTVLAAAPSSELGLFDPDANHLWNRLHSAFFVRRVEVRSGRDGGTDGAAHGAKPQFITLGPDRIDPPLGRHPLFLLDDEPFARCDALLDEFLATHAEDLINDPFKRVVLQHDLWAVFDLLQADPRRVTHGTQLEGGLPVPTAEHNRRKEVLSRKIAQVMRALALPTELIRELPQPLADPRDLFALLDRPTPVQDASAPLDLLHNQVGEWTELAFPEEHILQHTRMVDGRSVFRIFVQAPGDPVPAERLIRWWTENARRNQETEPGIPAIDLPQGVRFLLLRELICLDGSMHPVPTGMIESVRRYSTNVPAQSSQAGTSFLEMKMRKAWLFHNRDNALEPATGVEQQFEGLATVGRIHTDPQGRLVRDRPFPQNCVQCHSGRTVSDQIRNDAAVRSLHAARPRTPNDPPAATRTIQWKKSRPDFQRLNQLWRGSDSSVTETE